MNQLLEKRTGRTEKVEKATGFDHCFSPEKGVEFGLCDEIVGFDKIMEG